MKMNKLLALMLVLALALSTCIFAYAENASAIPEIPAELIVEEDLTQMQPAEPAAPAERQRRRAPVHTDRLTVGQQPVSPADADAMARRKSDMKALKPGDRVAHQTFGEGVILSVKPMGGDILFEVMFDTAGTKKLMGTYARLRHIG